MEGRRVEGKEGGREGGWRWMGRGVHGRRRSSIIYLSRCHVEEGDLEHPASGGNKCLTL